MCIKKPCLHAQAAAASKTKTVCQSTQFNLKLSLVPKIMEIIK